MLRVVAVVIALCACDHDEARVSCDADGSDQAALYQRGGALIGPHMILADRAAAARNDRDVRVGVACFDQVLVLAPRYWQALWLRGKGLQALGDHSRAVASFRDAYRIQPADIDVGRELEAELLEVRGFAEAVTVARAMSAIVPANAGLEANLAVALALNGQLAEARQAVARALQLDSNDQITKALAHRLDEIATGARKLPSTLDELQRD
jgi:tetratricopeptide (TPR) repeat protein